MLAINFDRLKAQLKARLRSDSGNAMVEFGIAAPVMVLLALGAIDFARLFAESTIMTSAANTGAFYGALNNRATNDLTGMQHMALQDASQLEGVTAVASRYCDCPDSPGIKVDCLETSCPNFGVPRGYVRTSVQKTFYTMGFYPGIPNETAMTTSGYVRVQ